MLTTHCTQIYFVLTTSRTYILSICHRLARQEDDLTWPDFYEIFDEIWLDLKVKTRIDKTSQLLKLRLIKPKDRKRKIEEDLKDDFNQVSQRYNPDLSN